MPISHKHKCIFIHIPKTAGSSIVEAILDINTRAQDKGKSDQNILRGIIPLDLRQKYDIGREWPEWQHLPATILKRVVPVEIWESYYKFAFVRNPWDRMVSWYSYYKQYVEIVGSRRDKVIAWIASGLGKDRNIVGSFEEWILAGCQLKNSTLPSARIKRKQLDWLTDREDGSILVDFIGRYEHLQEDFKVICDRLGICSQLPHVRRSKRQSYREYYSEQTKNLVAEWFKDDIEFFNYEF